MTKKSVCLIAMVAGAALCATASAKPWPQGAKPGKVTRTLMGPDGPGFSDNFDSYATGSGLAGQGGWQFWDGGLGGSQNATITAGAATCYPDCNNDGVLTVADFGCFQSRFVAGQPYADCNNSGSLTVADFGCFQSAFVAGCAGATNKYALATVETDVVQMFNITATTNPSGKWQLKADTYIPSTQTGDGFVILLNTASPPPVNGLWSIQVHFNTAVITSDFGGQTTSPILDQWVPLVCDIDLLADTLNITYGGTQFVTGATYTTNVSGSGTPTIQCLDLYSQAAGFRWDNISLMPVP